MTADFSHLPDCYYKMILQNLEGKFPVLTSHDINRIAKKHDVKKAESHCQIVDATTINPNQVLYWALKGPCEKMGIPVPPILIIDNAKEDNGTIDEDTGAVIIFTRSQYADPLSIATAAHEIGHGFADKIPKESRYSGQWLDYQEEMHSDKFVVKFFGEQFARDVFFPSFVASGLEDLSLANLSLIQIVKKLDDNFENEKLAMLFQPDDSHPSDATRIRSVLGDDAFPGSMEEVTSWLKKHTSHAAKKPNTSTPGQSRT